MTRTALGYTSKETIETLEVSSVEELEDAIEKLIHIANTPSYATHVEDGRGDNLSLRLIKNTLTDGTVRL